MIKRDEVFFQIIEKQPQEAASAVPATKPVVAQAKR
jgi:hypothetical protein